ncbi:MAG: hypothetical protein M1822_008377, partial [Bathelium mastoideum]
MVPTKQEEMLSLMRERDVEEEIGNDSGEDLRNSHVYDKLGLRKQRHAIVFHITLLTLYTAAFWGLSISHRRSFSCLSNSLVYSPARDAVRFKKQSFDAELVIESDYIGDPTPQSDLAWHVLLENMNIAVPKSDLDKINATSIGVPNEP